MRARGYGVWGRWGGGAAVMRLTSTLRESSPGSVCSPHQVTNSARIDAYSGQKFLKFILHGVVKGPTQGEVDSQRGRGLPQGNG